MNTSVTCGDGPPTLISERVSINDEQWAGDVAWERTENPSGGVDQVSIKDPPKKPVRSVGMEPSVDSRTGLPLTRTAGSFRISFISSAAPLAREALCVLAARYGQAPIDDSDVVVAIGGDGIMIDALHRILALEDVVPPPPVFGIHRGTAGFLMNDYGEDELPERIATAVSSTIFPLRMRATQLGGDQVHEELACNEVALRRLGGQSARLRISVDGEIRMPQLVGDGMLVATPAGSTAYNRSARGPIIPLDGKLLALTPICPLRPLHWTGALLSHLATVRVDVIEPALRPVSATADQREFRSVQAVEVAEARDRPLRLLFDCGHALEERVVRAQFGADPADRLVVARQPRRAKDGHQRAATGSPSDHLERGGTRARTRRYPSVGRRAEPVHGDRPAQQTSANGCSDVGKGAGRPRGRPSPSLARSEAIR
jgi:NAD+ kinase